MKTSVPYKTPCDTLLATCSQVGPGTGVLTKYLLEKPTETYVAEIDSESIEYLKLHYQKLENKHFTGDFLKINLSDVFSGEVAVIGNFPYNISSQILFKSLSVRACCFS